MNNKLNQFNEGGSHSENPNGGIYQGMGSNGAPNTVEEGETKLKDFIYSDRITLTKDMVKEFGLPSSLANKTVANASKILDKKFDGRTDKISNSTRENLLGRIAQAQETVKAKQEALVQALNNNATQMPEGLPGEPMAYGGRINKFLLGGNSMNTEPNSSNMFGFTAGQTDDLINKYPTSTSIGSETKVEGGGSGISGYYGLLGAAAGGIGNSLKGNSPLSNDGLMSEGEQKTNQAYEGVKSGVAAAIPIAGLFNGVEKLGKGLGQSIGGNTGGDIAQGALDPFSMLMRKDIKSEDKAKMLLLNGDPIIAGMMTHKANQKRRKEIGKQTALSLNSQYNDDSTYAKGGKLNKFAPGGPLDPTQINEPIINLQDILGVTTDGIFGPNSRKALINWQKSQGINADGKYGPQTFQKAGLDASGNKIFRPRVNSITDTDAYQNLKLSTDLSNQYNTQNNQINTPNIQIPNVTPTQESNNTLGKTADWLGNNYGDILRMAPIATNALQLAQLKKPDRTTLGRLSNRYNPSYVDEAQLQNITDQELNNSSNAIQNMGGSAGVTRNALLANSLNKTKGLSEAYMRAQQLNAGQDAVAQNFNLGVDQTNLSQSNQEIDINDRNQANYRNQKSKLIAALGTDIGEVGKEQVYKKLAREAFGYTWDGKYYVKPDGSKISKTQFEKEVDDNKPKTNQSRLGGMLNKKLK